LRQPHLGATFIKPQQAVEVVNGARPEQLAKIRRQHIGFVFQSFHLFPTLTAAGNVWLALDMRAERRASAKAKSSAVLDKVGLSRKAAAFPRDLSGGENRTDRKVYRRRA
jgi:putative ABC transport system ATP-binding protein